jgi:hypothetical protein
MAQQEFSSAVHVFDACCICSPLLGANELDFVLHDLVLH